jgi:hypothetical protein
VTSSKPPHFNTYDEFFAYYLQQHSDPVNRWLHACGTVLSFVFIGAMIYTDHAWWALGWPVVAYGFAWFGHFVIEGNRPATFGHPWWSFISDFRMLWWMLTGKLNQAQNPARANSQSA